MSADDASSNCDGGGVADASFFKHNKSTSVPYPIT